MQALCPIGVRCNPSPADPPLSSLTTPSHSQTVSSLGLRVLANLQRQSYLTGKSSTEYLQRSPPMLVLRCAFPRELLL